MFFHVFSLLLNNVLSLFINIKDCKHETKFKNKINVCRLDFTKTEQSSVQPIKIKQKNIFISSSIFFKCVSVIYF